MKNDGIRMNILWNSVRNGEGENAYFSFFFNTVEAVHSFNTVRLADLTKMPIFMWFGNQASPANLLLTQKKTFLSI